MTRFILFCSYILFSLSVVLSATWIPVEITYEKCDNISSYPVELDELTIERNVDTVRINTSLTFGSIIESPVKVEVTLERRCCPCSPWVNVPCEDNVGSCTFDDACKFANKINATCPIPAGPFVRSVDIPIEKFENLVPGSYRQRILISNAKQLLSCYNYTFEIRCIPLFEKLC